VVGVAPRSFAGFEEPPALYAPLAMLPALTGNGGQLDEPRGSWLRAAARLKPGVAVPAAAAALRLAAERFVAATDTSLAGRSATAVPMRGVIDPHNREQALPVLLLLMAVPLMVLLIACANVANLQLSRAAARRREVGVRRALGATRGRLVRQLLVESVVLAMLGGGAGLVLSMWLSQAIVALSGAPDFLIDLAAPDARVIAFTTALSLLAGVVFGLAPALGATRMDVATVLKDETGSAPRGRSRLAGTFVMAQVAASLVLLVVSGLFLRSLRKAAAVDVGFETRGRVAASFDLGLLGYDGAHRDAFYRRLLDRVRALPDVRSATLTTNLPLSGRLYSAPILDAEPGAAASPVDGAMTWIWPEYLGTMGVTLLVGRDFAFADDSLATKVVIVNRTMAQRLWPGREALGRHLRVGQDGPPLEVVGVVRDGKYDALTEDAMPFLYIPMRQASDGDTRATVLVHADGPPQRIIGALRALLGEMDRNLPVYDAATLTEHVAARLDVERATSTLLGVFGGVALLLATLGLYAVMAYTVARRTREMGIRMALGAARRDVLGLVVGDGLRLAGIGIVIGLALAGALTRIVRRFLYGVTPTDAFTFVAVAGLLTAVAMLASWIPARRATRVDPVVALRAE
jgi:putative ABC transport system permease protein